MIEYEPGSFHLRMLCQLRGSVAPFAGFVALPPAIFAVLLSYYTSEIGETPLASLGLEESSTVAGQAWSGVTALLGFVIVFRSSQAYSRFWEGTAAMYQMSGEWFDAASSLVAFCKRSTAEMGDVAVFQHTLVRLVSMLSAVVLMDLASPPSWDSEKERAKKEKEKLSHPFSEENGRAFELELIDAEGIDRESLITISESDEKVELIFHWINQLIVETNSRNLFSVQPPLLTRAFQELAGGMVKYHDAMKIARIPLPFPYVQTLEILLLLHWLSTPFLTAMWVKSEVWAGILAFLQVFCLWSLNSIAAELENPFGEDVNDLPAQTLQKEMNNRLLLLIRPSTQRTARLCEKACLEEMDTGKGIQKLPTSVGFGKRGVTGFNKATDRLMSRRISLGGLQAAMADEVLVQIEECAPTELVLGKSDTTESFNSDNPLPLRRNSTQRKVTIREVKVPSRVGSKDFGAASQPLGGLLQPKDGADPMQRSEAQSLGSASLISDVAAQHRLLQLFEASRQDLRELIAICDELRFRSRDLGGDIFSAAVKGAWFAGSGAAADGRGGGGPSTSPAASTTGVSASPPPPRGIPDPGSGLGPTSPSRFLSTTSVQSIHSVMPGNRSPASRGAD